MKVRVKEHALVTTLTCNQTWLMTRKILAVENNHFKTEIIEGIHLLNIEQSCINLSMRIHLLIYSIQNHWLTSHVNLPRIG